MKAGYLVAGAALAGVAVVGVALSWPARDASHPPMAAHAPEAPPPAPVIGAAEPEPAAAPRPDAPTRCRPEPPVAIGHLPLPHELALAIGEVPWITGSASIGKPTRGSLWSGVELTESADIERAGGYPWGTETAVRSIERAAREARRCHPDSPRLRVGDLGRVHGGWLRPHRSHQSGLDADIGYFYRTPSVWYLRATAQTLDAARTWTLVRAFIEGGNVDTIFIDASVQQLLKAHLAALGPGEQPAAGVFSSPTKRDAIIRHAWGHASHFHVRFRNPEATALGSRIERAREPRLRRR